MKHYDKTKIPLRGMLLIFVFIILTVLLFCGTLYYIYIEYENLYLLLVILGIDYRGFFSGSSLKCGQYKFFNLFYKAPNL